MNTTRLQIRLLGPVGVSRDGVAVALPRSRKVRALLAYLVLSPAPVSRSRLCDLLWDVPNDPRGELRWCLSKLRGVLDDDRRRVLTGENNEISLDLEAAQVDALDVERLAKAGIDTTSTETLLELVALFGGDFLDGSHVGGSPEFTGWFSSHSQRFRNIHQAALAELVARAPKGSESQFRHIEAWLRVSPFEEPAHVAMLSALSAGGRLKDAEDHVARTIRTFEHEGLDWAPLRDAWRALERTVGEARVAAPPASVPERAATEESTARRRVSVAVMPFRDTAADGGGKAGDGLTEDIITRLAKLRVLFVIARGTVFSLGERGIGAREAARLLNVQYVVSGTVRHVGGRLSVVAELAETDGERIVWTDEFDGGADETFAVLDAIVNRIVAAVAEEIEAAEVHRALLKPPSSLSAWEAYHRGLWHMYKFTGPDNQHAERLFRDAIRLDPTFSRAFAGLSFTHFQNAFLQLTPDRAAQIDHAFEAATHSLGADDRDPAAHWAMGRALWLRGSESESVSELERSIELSPNFALGHYTLGFVQSQSGDPHAAIDATNHSRELSPFDPLQFAMLASRAIAHVRLGELNEAADWAVKATGRPNAHAHILAIAAQCLALANRKEEARQFVARIRERVPSYDVDAFLSSFRFSPDAERLFRTGAKVIGFDSR